MPIRACFLDIDGVVLDPDRTHEEWKHLMGEVLAPALGRTPVDWGRANGEVFPRVFADRSSWYDDDPIVAMRNVDTQILFEACRFLDVRAPSDEEAIILCRQVDVFVSQHTQAAFPAVTSAVHALAERHALHTATGNPSWRVEPLLEQLGVRDSFGLPCGPDLLGVMKDTVVFYERLFHLAEVEPADAVVIDDNPSQLEIARAVGTRTILVGAADPNNTADAVISNISDLPAAVSFLA